MTIGAVSASVLEPGLVTNWFATIAISTTIFLAGFFPIVLTLAAQYQEFHGTGDAVLNARAENRQLRRKLKKFQTVSQVVAALPQPKDAPEEGITVHSNPMHTEEEANDEYE